MRVQFILGGGFDISQTVLGKLAEFNLWNTSMSQSQLNSMTCGTTGNIVSWNTLLEKGTANRTYENFPECS